MANKIPGQQGVQVIPFSTEDVKALGKFTDSNHLSQIVKSSPDEYDKKIINLYTQSGVYSNDFTNMINKTTPFFTKSGTWTWNINTTYEPNRITVIPDATAASNTLGIDESTFQFVTLRPQQIGDVLTAHKMYGDGYKVVAEPAPYGTGFLLTVKLVGANVTKDSVASHRWLKQNQEIFQVDHVTGEFGQHLSGLDGQGKTIKMMDTMAQAYGVEHTITKDADRMILKGNDGSTSSYAMGRNSSGQLLDAVAYVQYQINEVGKPVVLGTRWEPFIEQEARKKMLRLRAERSIWGLGGSSTEGQMQEVVKHIEGAYHKMKNHAHYVDFNEGEFTPQLLRDVFGDLFYRRVDMKDRKVKLFTNESGIALFRQANKDDLAASGLTLMVDMKEYGANPKAILGNMGYDMMFSMETGVVEVSHLSELDQPQTSAEFNLNRKSPPVFMVFDMTNQNGGLSGVREVRLEGRPAMEWGYIHGRSHHLGHAYSKGMESANMFPGYKMWFDDRFDIFAEDLSRMVLIEQTPQI